MSKSLVTKIFPLVMASFLAAGNLGASLNHGLNMKVDLPKKNVPVEEIVLPYCNGNFRGLTLNEKNIKALNLLAGLYSGEVEFKGIYGNYCEFEGMYSGNDLSVIEEVKRDVNEFGVYGALVIELESIIKSSIYEE